MAYGLTPAGFVPKPLDACKAELEEALRGAFGQGINLTPPSRFATIVGVLADRESELWDLAAAVYASFDPDQAVGEALENVSALTGTRRAAPTSSIVREVALTGTRGTTVLAGKVLSVFGAPESRFALAEDVTLDEDGSGVGLFVAEKTGPISAPAGSLTVIETPVAGWQAATNPVDAELGTHLETDPTLRVRRRIELQSLGNAALDAIRGDVLQVKDVLSCSVFENDDALLANAEGMPPKSVEVVVVGGDDEEIAAAIFASVAAGIATHGTTSIVVIDSEKTEHVVKFTRPATIPLYLTAAIAKDPKNFPGDGEARIRAALLDFARTTYAGGVDVVASRLYGPIASVPGVLDVTLAIGAAPNPAGTARIPVSTRQRAALEDVRIALTFADEVP